MSKALKKNKVKLNDAVSVKDFGAAAWSLGGDGKWQAASPLIDGLFYFVQKDHCAKAWLWQHHLYKKE